MKLDIIGSVASGKATLAKKLSNEYNVPCYEKDIKSKLAEYGERFLIFNSSGDVELFVKQKYKK